MAEFRPRVRTRNTTWTAWEPISAMLSTAPQVTIHRRYRSRPRKRTPSAIRCRSGTRSSSWAGAGSATSIRFRQNAETRNVTASAISPLTAPTAWASSPAAPGPATWVAALLPCSLALPSRRSRPSSTIRM